jgi:hypothetical protein
LFGVAIAACERAPSAQVPDDQEPEEFEFAGVVEGFYGTPWSQQDRMDILTFLGTTVLDTYVYAPKNDPYHLTRWREPYPADQLRALRELADHAAANDVVFWYAISPGLSMRYASDEDYRTLVGKIDAVSEVGIRHFGLFLDDVPLQLEHDSDRQQFGSLAAAHVFLINRLKTDLDARGFELMATPTVYTAAWDDPNYVNRLGEGVHPDVPLVWTGPDVATDSITAAESQAWSRRLQRRLVLWDNYPVNDFAPWRVFLGPVRGRDPRLPASTVGILANPMNQAHASMIGLRTLSDYVERPREYDPDASLDDAVRELFGAELVSAMQPLIDAFGDYASEDHFAEPLYFLRDTIAIGVIDTRLTRLEAALDTLDRAATTTGLLRAFVDELRPIVERNRSRLGVLQADDRYRPETDVLIFESATETIVVGSSDHTVLIDGTVDEWQGTPWRRLHGHANADVAITTQGQHVYMAVRVYAGDITALDGARIGEGAHIQLVVSQDHTSDRITSNDLFVLISPATSADGSASFVGSMKFQGFMAKWLADNESLRLTEFHLTTFALPPAAPMARVARALRYATSTDDTGFTVELAFPYRSGIERISLTASAQTNERLHTSSLGRRNYPINPRTFVRLSIP